MPTFVFSWKPNAKFQLPLEAGATELGRRKARCITGRFLTPPVENRTYGFHRIRLNTLSPSPWHYATKRSFPFRQLHGAFPMDSLRVRCVPLVRSSQGLGAFAMGPHPRVDGLPVRRLLRPIRHPSQASGFRPGSPPSYCPPPLASCEELPVFSMADSSGTRQVACSPYPFRSLRLPSLCTEGRTG